MAYPQDLVGKFIHYTVDPGGTAGTTPGLVHVNGLVTGQTTAATVSVYRLLTGPAAGGHRTAAVASQFVNMNVPWSFTFLKYLAGAVTTAPLGGPLLTGPMSGCYLCCYTQAGQQGLAHIGTANAPDSDESIAAKTAWTTFVSRADVSGITAANPFDYFSTTEFQAAMLSPSAIPHVVGYFAAGSAWAMLLAPVPQNMRPPVALLKVAGVKPMTMQPWATIAAMRTFRT